ncbi:MAG: Sigma-fimbriae tip adhesin [Gammaproteobacteria bacterium]|nr:Sigma-fimbriae tip adhesin [Gammaproteobacteria bacterium]
MLKQKLNAGRLMAAGMAALAMGTVSSTDAATATSNLAVTASVSANCTIITALVAFGAYDPVSANATTALNGTGTVSVTCTNGATTTVTLGEGANAGGGSTAAAPARRLKDGGTDFLTYSLYTDTGRTAVWGDTAGTGLAHTGTGTLTALTVYGAVNAGQNVPAGNYSDTVVATITF